MDLMWLFVINSILLGVGLAADAFSVSVVDGIKCPHIACSKAFLIAGLFAFFQALMPMTGWFLTNRIMEYFKVIQPLLPWISRFFLLYLGFRMILDSREKKSSDLREVAPTMRELLFQAVATSIDALLVGFAIAAYSLPKAFSCSIIIALVTFVICFIGVHCGKALGLKLAGKAGFVGGMVLILIAVEDFVHCSFIA